MSSIKKILAEFANLDMPGISAEYIIHRLCDVALPSVNKIINNKKHNNPSVPNYEFDKDIILKQILNNSIQSYNWSNEIKFKDLKESKNILDVFVELDFYLTPREVHHDSNLEERINMYDVLDFSKSNYLILGGPGAGKTTLTKKITKLILETKEFGKSKFAAPFVIRLREVKFPSSKFPDITNSLFFILMKQLGIIIKLPPLKKGNRKIQHSIEDYSWIMKTIAIEFIESLNILFVLDGFDEISNQEIKENIRLELDEISRSLNQSRFILTSRTADLDSDIQNCKTLEICPLNNDQIREFLEKWIPEGSKAKDLFHQIKTSPFSDIAMRPINLAHLCALYERYNQIPDRPKSIYRKIIQLLIEDWDNQRAINRKSKYADFSVDRKFEFLSRLAFSLSSQYNSTVFSKSELNNAYLKIHKDFGLPKSQMVAVIGEIESYTGLLLRSGFNKYEFSHKSLQEYLIAEYLVRSSTQSLRPEVIVSLANEIAIAAAISLTPNDFLANFFAKKIELTENIPQSFFSIFLQRLLIEKPDFTTSPTLAFLLCYIYSHTCKALKIQEFPIYDIHFVSGSKKLHAKNSVIKALRLLIKSHPNVNESLRNLKEYYTLTDTALTSLKHRKISTSNNSDNYCYEIRNFNSIDALEKQIKILHVNELMISIMYDYI